MRKVVKIKVKVVPHDTIASESIVDAVFPIKRFEYRGSISYSSKDGEKEITVQTAWYPSKEEAIQSLAATVLNNPVILSVVLEEYSQLVKLISEHKTPISPRDILYNNGVDIIKAAVLYEHIEKREVKS